MANRGEQANIRIRVNQFVPIDVCNGLISSGCNALHQINIIVPLIECLVRISKRMPPC